MIARLPLPALPWFRRVPFVQQTQAADCGAACLAMVLGFYGKAVTLNELQHVLGVGRDGTTALSLVEAGRLYGLVGQGLRVEVEDLRLLEPGTILHWEFRHFVVLEGVSGNRVRIVDPAAGRRWVSMRQCSESFTGIAVTFAPGPEFQRSVRLSHPYWRHLRLVTSEPGLMARVLFVSITLQLVALGLPFLTSTVVDRVIPLADYGLLSVLGAGLLVLAGFQVLSALVRSHLLVYLRTLIDHKMMTDFMSHLVRLPYVFFQTRSSGDLLMRANSHATVREVLTASALSSLLDGVLATAYLAAIIRLNQTMGFMALGLAFLQVFVLLIFGRTLRETLADNLSAQSESQGYLVQMLAAMEDLKASSSEGRALDHWRSLYGQELRSVLNRGRLTASMETLMGLFRMATPLLILYFGGIQVLRGNLTLGTMLGLQALTGSFLAPVSSLVATAQQLQTVQSYVDRINDILDAPPEQDQQQVATAHALTGRITVEHVSFRYSPLSPLALEGITLDIQPGQFVAIVGRSGSGKTTLGKLILGLHTPTAGRVLYDGVDLAGLEAHSVRSQVGVVPQSPHLFGATILSNLSLMKPHASLAEVMRAAELAQVHDDISAMPMGYQTVLADGGASLSGGQRQRLALARALVHSPRILLLDEATSALDTVTESRIQESLASLDCTRIVIAQRLSTVRQADLILVMDKGRIVESGTHESLLCLNGIYETLVRTQHLGLSA